MIKSVVDWLGPRRAFLSLMAAALLHLYGGSYFYLSRRGMQEANELNMKGFLYVRAQEGFETKDLRRHYALATIYAPLNAADRALSAAPGAVRCIMFELDFGK